MQDYNIGQPIGASLAFSAADRAAIRQVLLSTQGIDAATTDVGCWNGLSRTASLAHGDNEKMTSAAVRQDRVVIKALPGNHCGSMASALPCHRVPTSTWLGGGWQPIAGMRPSCWWKTGRRLKPSTR